MRSAGGTKSGPPSLVTLGHEIDDRPPGSPIIPGRQWIGGRGLTICQRSDRRRDNHQGHGHHGQPKSLDCDVHAELIPIAGLTRGVVILVNKARPYNPRSIVQTGAAGCQRVHAGSMVSRFAWSSRWAWYFLADLSGRGLLCHRYHHVGHLLLSFACELSTDLRSSSHQSAAGSERSSSSPLPASRRQMSLASVGANDARSSGRTSQPLCILQRPFTDQPHPEAIPHVRQYRRPAADLERRCRAC